MREVAAVILVLAGLIAGGSLAVASYEEFDDDTPSAAKKQYDDDAINGRMTGDGHQFDYQGFDKVAWEFRNSVCNSDEFPDLKVEFGSNLFILTAYTSPLTCFTLNPPSSTEEHPEAGFDSIRGTGTGTLNGVSGAEITFRFTDSGEPGRADSAEFTITAPDGTTAIAYTGGAIDGGNHQAHSH